MHQKAIENISALEPQKRYEHFIKTVVDFEVIYTLQSDDDAWAISTIADKSLYPVWPNKEFAHICCTGEWANFKIMEIDLYDFLENILPSIEEEAFLINAFPLQVNTGFVVTVKEFSRDINEEMQHYL